MSDWGAYEQLRQSMLEWDRHDREAPVLVKLACGRTMELRRDVPATRGDCPKERPCPHVRCEHHLYTIAGADRVGRTAGGYRMAATLYPGWLENPPPPSCDLDFAERVARGDEADIHAIAQALHKTVDWTQRLLRRALRKWKAMNPEDPR